MIVAASEAAIARAAALIRTGGLVAFPTETVYGLGADATDDHAVARIFAAKGRPRFNPLIVHVADEAAAAALVVWTETARELARRFWPGPLTLVLARREGCPVSRLASAGLATLAVRMPAHPVAEALIAAVGRPIAAPSANRSGAVSATTAAHVARSLGAAVELVLDGGPSRIGLESTVVELTGPRPVLLRHGGASAEDVEKIAGPLAERTAASDAPAAPGMLASHYAPHVALRTDVVEVHPGEALLAFGPHPLPGAVRTLNLSPAGDLVEAAANLFAMLHALDDPSVTGIAVMAVPERGLGRAINDRLRRAAWPRSLPGGEALG
ncbi:MAG: threonylcarbamoyl-AMP synthase [Alphaproteobacteria bacterium]|nr:threonylcarbamoyl-AMP synthase [Alphaproteobacteria bacterium]